MMFLRVAVFNRFMYIGLLEVIYMVVDLQIIKYKHLIVNQSVSDMTKK